MRSLLVLLSLAATVHAAEPAKPNTLTPKEIEEGWILLFDGETTFGWKTEGDVKVENGVLLLGGAKRPTLTTTSIFPPAELRFEFKTKQMIDCMKLNLRGLVVSNDTSSRWNRATILWNRVANVSSPTYSIEPQIELGRMRLGQSGRRTTETEPIVFESPADNVAEIRSIKLRPLEAKPLFNGKDLAGWKVFEDPKRNKSKWTVTKEGWLNVKNGPGDLQTERKYADFLLQLECISNGKWLNSGVFFRCVANECQNGYEAQIQNGYKDNDRTKPVDFGTGAIYRRVPARKVVPNDNEWFTMTVLAHGNHIATWVNGYQTVDWTDERPPNNNPRNGSKTGAGHISIQGHDPTTDLSFRNIRIVEMKFENKK
jgi:hypothetical protein